MVSRRAPPSQPTEADVAAVAPIAHRLLAMVGSTVALAQDQTYGRRPVWRVMAVWTPDGWRFFRNGMPMLTWLRRSRPTPRLRWHEALDDTEPDEAAGRRLLATANQPLDLDSLRLPGQADGRFTDEDAALLEGVADRLAVVDGVVVGLVTYQGQGMTYGLDRWFTEQRRAGREAPDVEQALARSPFATCQVLAVAAVWAYDGWRFFPGASSLPLRTWLRRGMPVPRGLRHEGLPPVAELEDLGGPDPAAGRVLMATLDRPVRMPPNRLPSEPPGRDPRPEDAALVLEVVDRFARAPSGRVIGIRRGYDGRDRVETVWTPGGWRFFRENGRRLKAWLEKGEAPLPTYRRDYEQAVPSLDALEAEGGWDGITLARAEALLRGV